MGLVDAWDRRESCPQESKEKNISKTLVLLYYFFCLAVELGATPGCKIGAAGFPNLNLFHYARPSLDAKD